MLVFNSQSHCQLWAQRCKASTDLQGHIYPHSTLSPKSSLPQTLSPSCCGNCHCTHWCSFLIKVSSTHSQCPPSKLLISHHIKLPIQPPQLFPVLFSSITFLYLQTLSLYLIFFISTEICLISPSEENTFRLQIPIQLSFFFPLTARMQVLYQVFDLQIYSLNQYFVFPISKQCLSKSRSSSFG